MNSDLGHDATFANEQKDLAGSDEDFFRGVNSRSSSASSCSDEGDNSSSNENEVNSEGVSESSGERARSHGGPNV